MIACYIFMTINNYEYLLSFDTINYFHPRVKEYLDVGNYIEALNKIWGEYSFFQTFQYGYFSYATLFAYIADAFGADFYIGQNLSVLFLYPFVGILIYKLIIVNGIAEVKAYRYAQIISFASIVFTYCFQSMRDLHILLIYLAGIYCTFQKEFSIKRIIIIIVLCLLCCTFRIESGLFLFTLIPIYMLLSLKQSRNKRIVLLVSTGIAICGLVILFPLLNDVSQLAEANYNYYSANIDQGDGVIGFLQRIPIAGDFASIIYTALQPIPSWSLLWISNPGMKYGGEAYNIMNFPRIISAFFNCIVIVYLLTWVCSKKLRRRIIMYVPKPLIYNLWMGIIFLYIQSAVVAQRRLMAYYCLFYVLFFIIYTNISANDRKQLTLVSVMAFIGLQFIGLILTL